MKLTFPPKKVQFWLLFTGLAASIVLLIMGFWTVIMYSEDMSSLFPTVVGTLIDFPFQLVMKTPLGIFFFDDYVMLWYGLSTVILYTSFFWLIGSIIWMVIQTIKDRKDQV